MGMNVSHIDSHEGALFFDPDVFKTYLKIAEDNNLLAFVTYMDQSNNRHLLNKQCILF